MSSTETPVLDKKSELIARVKTAIPAAIVVIAIMGYAPLFVLGFVVMIFAMVGTYEFDKMFLEQKIRLSLLAMMGSSFVIGGATVAGGAFGLTAAFLLSILGLFFYYLLLLSPQNTEKLNLLGISLLGVIWISWGFNHLTLIKDLPHGTSLLFLLVLSIWVSDIAAYFGGKAFGQKLLAPTISPKKTIEGSICGLLGSGIVAAVFSMIFLDTMGWILGGFVGIISAAVGQLGDLIESKIKRLCEVKDSGSIFPGHGGVLDRVDGFLTAAPVFYYFMLWFSRS
ncbi:MAG: phosphatidate cytidylyltransferase [SAR324 cluster bacterium]|nr:phosphatidate cytidylyltransferase [SAR324 cluster bacterium]